MFCRRDFQSGLQVRSKMKMLFQGSDDDVTKIVVISRASQSEGECDRPVPKRSKRNSKGTNSNPQYLPTSVAQRET